MYDEKGQAVWEAHLDIYGKVRTFAGRSLSDCPFRYQGQYEDAETGLYYNRFRYYSPEEGMYLSKDPIGLAGNNPTLYGYVKDVNNVVDIFGLTENPLVGLDLNNMNRQQISQILSNADNITYKGGSPKGEFMQWKYSDTGITAVRIDLPDSVTNYDHIHLFDTKGNPLSVEGKIVDAKSPEAHIKIKCN
jgi:RHS repeat-associated protein